MARRPSTQPNVGVGLKIKSVVLDLCVTNIGRHGRGLVLPNVFSLRFIWPTNRRFLEGDPYSRRFWRGTACWAGAQQQHYGNEWIKYDQRYWAFWVGTTADAWPDLFEGSGVSTAPRSPMRFPGGHHGCAFHPGLGASTRYPSAFRVIPMACSTARISSNSYSPKNDAWLDSALWDDPAHMNNPYSAIGDSTQFFTIGDVAESKRVLYEGPRLGPACRTSSNGTWAETNLIPNGPFHLQNAESGTISDYYLVHERW